MKLTFDEIASLTQGAERIEEKDGRVVFYRFDAEEERVYSTSPLYARTFATAGVKLHFKTDAESLFMKVMARAVVEGNSKVFAFDVYEDGKYLGSIKNYDESLLCKEYLNGEYKVGEYCESFCLESGEKEIEIYFPWSLAGEICEMELCGASYARPVKRTNKLLVYGDSIVQGTAALNPSRVHTVKLSDFLDAELHSKAIGSEVYFPELAKIRSEKYTPDYIYVGYGANDWYTLGYDDAKNRCKLFWEAICKNYPDAVKICVSPIWYRDHKVERPFGDISGAEKIQREVTEAIGAIHFVRGWELVPQTDDYFADGVHPTNEGFDFFFENLRKSLNLCK